MVFCACGSLSVGCLLAAEYPLSEPRAPGLLHSVLGGPSLHPPVHLVRTAAEMECGQSRSSLTADLEGLQLPLDV